jgi:hypothetical protein
MGSKNSKRKNANGERKARYIDEQGKLFERIQKRRSQMDSAGTAELLVAVDKRPSGNISNSTPLDDASRGGSRTPKQAWKPSVGGSPYLFHHSGIILSPMEDVTTDREKDLGSFRRSSRRSEKRAYASKLVDVESYTMEMRRKESLRITGLHERRKEPKTAWGILEDRSRSEAGGEKDHAEEWSWKGEKMDNFDVLFSSNGYGHRDGIQETYDDDHDHDDDDDDIDDVDVWSYGSDGEDIDGSLAREFDPEDRDSIDAFHDGHSSSRSKRTMKSVGNSSMRSMILSSRSESSKGGKWPLDSELPLPALHGFTALVDIPVTLLESVHVHVDEWTPIGKQGREIRLSTRDVSTLSEQQVTWTFASLKVEPIAHSRPTIHLCYGAAEDVFGVMAMHMQGKTLTDFLEMPYCEGEDELLPYDLILNGRISAQQTQKYNCFAPIGVKRGDSQESYIAAMQVQPYRSFSASKAEQNMYVLRVTCKMVIGNIEKKHN